MQYTIMQDTITDVKHQKSTHMRPIGLSRNADKSSQVMMKHSHHTAYKAYLATTGEKATAAYQHLFITGTTTVVLTQVYCRLIMRASIQKTTA